MTEQVALETLARDIRQRLDAVDNEITTRVDSATERMERSVAESVSDTRLAELIRTYLPDVLKDEEFQRKMRFGGGAERPVVGTRYARWGLNVSDVEFLHDLQVSLTGQKRVRGVGVYEGPSQELTRTFDAISDAYYLPSEQVRAIDQRAIDDLFPRLPLDVFHGPDKALARRGDYELTGAYQRAMRAMDTAESGYGSQLVGAQYVHDLWEMPRKLGRIFPLVESFEMTDPTAYLPVEADLPEMLFVSESTSSSSSAYTTSKAGSQRIQVDAKKFVIHMMWSGEMEEDSIVAFIPFLRRQAGKSIAHYSDSLLLNGDTTNAGTGNINLDDADPADSKHYLAFDATRHAWLVDNTANGQDAAGSVTLTLLNALRAKMIDTTFLVDWGHPTDPDDLVWISDPFTADKIALLDEYVTRDKYGDQAGVFNGEAGRILGHRHISTIAMSRTEADGKVSTTGSNNVKGQVQAMNRRGFTVGWRRRVMNETERLPATDQTRLVFSLRLGLGRATPTGAASGIESVAGLYNISL